MSRRTLPLWAAFVLALGLGACATGPYGPVYGPHRPVATPPPPTSPSPPVVRDTEPPVTLPPNAPDTSGFTLDAAGESWGLGYLSVSGAGLDAVRAPLHEAPSTPIWGWLVAGRGYDIDGRRTLPARPGARLRLPGDGDGLVVLETAPDGWMKVRWGAPSDPLGGVGWTDTKRWRGGAPRFVVWEDQIAGARGVTYRDSGTSYNLREGPGTSHGVVRVLTGDNYDLTVLEIAGEWMRVRAHTPPACGVRRDVPGLLGGVSRQETEGWIYWRSARRGPWVRPFGGDCGPGA